MSSWRGDLRRRIWRARGSGMGFGGGKCGHEGWECGEVGLLEAPADGLHPGWARLLTEWGRAGRPHPWGGAPSPGSPRSCRLWPLAWVEDGCGGKVCLVDNAVGWKEGCGWGRYVGCASVMCHDYGARGTPGVSGLRHWILIKVAYCLMLAGLASRIIQWRWFSSLVPKVYMRI